MQSLALLKRDWYEFRKYFISYLVVWFLLPVLLHLLLAIPLSRIVILEIQYLDYLNWASVGIWCICGSMVSFFETAIRMRKINYETRQIDSIIKSPISNYQLLIMNCFRGVIFGMIQFFCAMIITCTLNNEYLGILDMLMVVIQMMNIALFFSVFGTLIGLIISNRIIFIQLSLVIFIIISFGMGSFIPLNSYPESYKTIINIFPINLNIIYRGTIRTTICIPNS